MKDGIGIQAHLPNFTTGKLIVLVVDGVFEKECRASLLRVHLDRKSDGGAEQKTFGGLLDEDFSSLLEAVSFAERRRDYDRSSFSDSSDLGHHW
jgi:hypothetical protein